MRILMLTPDYPPQNYGGIGTHVYFLVQELIKNGHKVDVIVIKSNVFICENYIQDSIENSVRIICFKEDESTTYMMKEKNLDIPSYRCVYNNMKVIFKVLEIIEGQVYDVLHIHDFYVSLIYHAISKVRSIPTVLTIHSNSTTLNSLGDSLRRYVRGKVDCVVAVSEYIKEQIQLKYGSNSLYPEIQVVHNSVFCNRFMPQYINNSRIKEITFCGRLSKTKGCEILIKSFASVLLWKSNITLNILGDGPEKKNLEKLVDELKIKNFVRFYGYVDYKEVNAIYKKSYIVVVPSRIEPFATVALEAMALAKCVVCSNIDGFKEMIQHNINGVLFEVNNEHDLANKLLHLLEHENETEFYSQNAYKTVRDNFSWKVSVKKIIKIYQMAIDKNIASKENMLGN